MTLAAVGILSPGDMGHAVGKMLGSHGMRVITCLQGRSERTRSLARIAEIEEVPSYPGLVSEADLILSIMVPAQAETAATLIAQAITETSADVVYADCNAISPATTRRIGDLVTRAGGRFVDASIIGGPPRRTRTTRFYASGPDVSAFAGLSAYGLDVVPLGQEIGMASAIKMCYAALTKGLTALCTELLTAAEALGVSEPLHREFQMSQASLFERMQRGLPGMPAKSRRWIGEMEEISQTFAQVGLTPKMLAGAAEMYRFVGDTALADRTPEDPDPLPALDEMISLLARHLANAQAPPPIAKQET
jgi:3-hydroxyisobutyrate dehydrogenase-like beta-hydroxyacid dehydrogenase